MKKLIIAIAIIFVTNTANAQGSLPSSASCGDQSAGRRGGHAPNAAY